MNPCHKRGVLFTGGPDLAEEIGGRDAAVLVEEIAVATATEHDVRIEFAAEFGAGFAQDRGR